jgi:two-component system chemotaxis response regulator CheY
MTRALVIDDSRTIRLILCRTLRGLGMEVSEAINGAEALAVIDGGVDAELILVDWNMPVMSGIAFIEAVRQPPRNSTAKIIMVTTETEVSQVMRALHAGADEYVMKPFTPEAILSKLHLLGLNP